MTKDEVIKIITITNTADNECPTCAEALALQIARAFPEHAEAIGETFGKDFGYEVEEFLEKLERENAYREGLEEEDEK